MQALQKQKFKFSSKTTKWSLSSETDSYSSVQEVNRLYMDQKVPYRNPTKCSH